MLEERMFEIDNEMNSLNSQVIILKKDGLQISSGLKQAISDLKIKQENIVINIELWRTMLKVYPNYDR